MSDIEKPVEVSSYEGPTQIDTDVAAFIKATADEFKQAEVDALPPEETTEEAPVVEAAPVVPAETAAPAPEVKPEERGIERLVEREVALRSREAELSARESRAAQMEARIKELEARALPDDVAQALEFEPEKVLQQMGVDPEMLVRQIIANRLGDSADPSVKDTIEKAKIKREINDLKMRLSEQQRVAQAQAFVAQVEAGAREYLTKGLSENDVPTVATVAKANSERVFREIMEEISRDASDKMARGLGGDVLPYTEAAKRVESRWAGFKSMLLPATPAPASTTVPTTTAQGAPAQAVKPTPPVIKSPDRPIAPWLQRGDIEEAGVKAGMAEYLRLQNKGQ